ncbi:MAG TPA: hypothetical protein VGL65_10590 [Gemmatimonadales bacterium]
MQPRSIGMAAIFCLSATATSQLGAQRWVSGDSLPLIRAAVTHRTARDADTLLASWQAAAHGFLRFASIVDHGDGPVERVIRADELRVEVYGESPNWSKQNIVAWRDTSFLPNEMEYHRDHLGIVANDFGPAIRLGQGDEVRDVPHPLSAAGLGLYLFSPGDTLLLSAPRGTVRVVAVEVRPRDPKSPGTVGTLYIDIDRAALVRFQFTFTPAAYRDRTVEDITVTLDNALEENARWLPWRQSIVIRRAAPWLESPIHTVIRGDWIIDDYQFGASQGVGRFAGPPIGGLRSPIDSGWSVPIASEIGELPATEGDVADVARRASQAIGGRSLDGLPRFRIVDGSLSDLIRVNRVEGVTVEPGSSLDLGRGIALHGRAGIGFSDDRVIWSAGMSRATGSIRWSIDETRTVLDIGDAPVISGVLNSVITAFDGNDHGDYTLIDHAMASATIPAGGTLFTVGGGWEESRPVETRFTPLTDSAAPNPLLARTSAAMARVVVSRRNSAGHGWTIDGEGGLGSNDWTRIRASGDADLPLSVGSIILQGEAGWGSAGLPAYRSFVLGGRGTLPGLPFRELGGRSVGLVSAGWSIPVHLPTPPFPYSRYVALPSTLEPFVAAGVAGGEIVAVPWRATGQVEPVAGVRLDLWGPLLRVESGISLRTGHAAISLDVHPDWWGVL